MRTLTRDARQDGVRVAVIGSGISGLSAAWLLSRHRDVTVYEASPRLGGHAHTVTVEMGDRSIPVDTGFIVYNDLNYPNLVALFEHLKVPTVASDMSFSASMEGGDFEYSGTGLGGLLGQKRNILRPRFWTMLRDVFRFYKRAPALVGRAEFEDVTLGEYLRQAGYSEPFINDHLIPMGAAIWSTTARDMNDYPLQAFLRFFVNHGLLLLSGRPQWRTVDGGSREYVTRIAADFGGKIRLSTPVTSIRRAANGVVVTDAAGQSDFFDDVVIAAHADEALAMLSDAGEQERELLGAFGYTANTAVLHSDAAMMPRRRRVWSSWNYMSGGKSAGQPLCVTYWMNRLQQLDTPSPLFLTLNPGRPLEPGSIHGSYDYTHPRFDSAALKAQQHLWELQGKNRTWFCGAYFGSGFHEDGLQSGLAVAEALGGVRRPWKVENESGRIPIPVFQEAAE
ncbi:Predicted NAD/FAD-binding protein [Rhizobium sp. NFR07]|uniref:NAD(P)/FAD-dependent oxidoreductase n=1 Tax=Rhizobium sp. NFR07 TaxID=1566262 RepID=UPI0008E3E267|nr:FAD-dependent oxidoreductase [Rhizobium sp. NFR07]SFB48223.1 Predicted NAD/FAD-binding protein [Rhizobium sp. NFR07]